MIFDLLTSPQGHQFDPRGNILLALCSQFDMPHNHVNKGYLTPLGIVEPPSPIPGAGPRCQNKTLV